ncbi:MAG: hypothetical protein JWP44_1581, partial [Mucilaginibacter sp.]|nr:hypothetical protein [Mucilaginibacter sp.]
VALHSVFVFMGYYLPDQFNRWILLVGVSFSFAGADVNRG